MLELLEEMMLIFCSLEISLILRLIRGPILIIILYRQVSWEDASKISIENNLLFFEASAKTGINVKALFNKMAATLPGLADLPSEPDSIYIYILYHV